MSDAAPGRARIQQVAAIALGCLALALAIANVPLARLGQTSMSNATGSIPVWFTAVYITLGLIIAWRRPSNVLGWIFIWAGLFGTLSQDASFYALAVYRVHQAGLPFGWVALLAQPGWAPMIVLFGLAVLMFPDGRPPSERWRWVPWAYLGLGLLWIAGAITLTIDAIIRHTTQVDSGGNLLLLSGVNRSAGWWNVVQVLFFGLLAVSWLGSVAGQVASYRRSSGERRQQLKWLVTGAVVVVVILGLKVALSAVHGIPAVAEDIGEAIALLALPLAMGVAIFQYRLLDIDRIVSRTLSYTIVTGLLVGVYAGIVILATQVISITTQVAVAASTLAAAALFNPLRRRVQRTVDRRFNRARYDADAAIAAFASRLQDAVDIDSVRDDLTGVVRQALEPAHMALWLSEHGG
jgi:hypothetical protein